MKNRTQRTLFLAASVALSAVPCAWAEGAADWSVKALASSPTTRAVFDAMKKGHRLPAWVARGGTESPAQTVRFDGHEVYVASACKPHDCASERVAVLYDPRQKVMYGLLSVVGKDSERLTWLNIGDGNESIDGRTILYAALTGSLANHPGAFNYK